MYTAIVGLVMLAAFLEWFLWIAAFMYCLVKGFIKAEHWTVRILAIVIGIVFLLLRYAFALTSPMPRAAYAFRQPVITLLTKRTV